MREQLQQAVEDSGGQSVVARAIGVTPQAVHEWLKDGAVPHKRVIAFCSAIGWRLTPHAMCPELYPDAKDGLPRDADPNAPSAHAAAVPG